MSKLRARAPQPTAAIEKGDGPLWVDNRPLFKAQTESPFNRKEIVMSTSTDTCPSRVDTTIRPVGSPAGRVNRP
jgi:hypothetical protein